MEMTVVAMLLGTGIGWLFGWLWGQEQAAPAPAPSRPPASRRYYFRCTLDESECVPARISGEIIAATEAEAWSWVRQSIVMPGEWSCEMWIGRPHHRVFVADIADGQMIVGRKLDRRTAALEH